MPTSSVMQEDSTTHPNPTLPGPMMLPPSQPMSSIGTNGRVPKRLIVCCDGTWQDGVISMDPKLNTNILRLSRMIYHEDSRNHNQPPIPQIVFYQSGIGTDNNFYSKYVDGATGKSLLCKVHEAYSFIANNYHQGDKIYLFGFSRGAYTARMTAALIGEIGVLDRKGMDDFGKILRAYQCKEKDSTKWEKIKNEYNSPLAKGRVRAYADKDQFMIQCLGVFDTVGSIGAPKEISIHRKMKSLLRFPDDELGSHVRHAFHAMALDEKRADFDVVKFKQKPDGKKNGQVLRQVWFTGSHSDIGGGYERHDLSDLTLTWMVSNIDEMLSLNHGYLREIPCYNADWGALPPTPSSVGIFKLSRSKQRTLPKETDEETYEYIHPSVRSRSTLKPNAKLQDSIKQNPALVCSLALLEEEIKKKWSDERTAGAGADPEGNVGKISKLLYWARTALTFRNEPVKEKGDD